MTLKKLIVVGSLVMSLPNISFAKEISVFVKGMVCSFCAQGITKKLSAEPAVEKVNVNLGKHLVEITTKKDQDLPDEKIRSVLSDSGYTVSNIKRK